MNISDAINVITNGNTTQKQKNPLFLNYFTM